MLRLIQITTPEQLARAKERLQWAIDDWQQAASTESSPGIREGAATTMADIHALREHINDRSDSAGD